MQNADALIRSMKQRTDALVASDEKLQQFLIWVDQKSLSVKDSHKPAAVRAFYFALGLDGALNRALDRELEGPLDRTLDDRLDDALDCALDRALNLLLDSAFESSLDNTPSRAVGFTLLRVPDPAHVRALKPELIQVLQQLYKKLPDRESDEKRFKRWWQANGQAWTRRLRKMTILHRNIGHDWQFSKEQKEVLRQYYDANKLLVKCLNSDCNVTPAVREEIEETLLLPITEIAKRRSCQDR